MENNLTEEKMSSPEIFNKLSERYDLLNRVLSLGIDVHWRKLLVERLERYLILNNLKNVKGIDVATGTGDLLGPIAKLPQVQEVLGLDAASNMLEIAKLKNAKYTNINFVCANAQKLPLGDQSVGFATLSFGLRNMPDYNQALDEIFRILRPGAPFYLLEFSLPTSRWFLPIYLFYFRHVLPHIGSVVSGHKQAYSYLNRTVEDFPYGEEMKKILEKHGFKINTIQPLTLGICTLYETFKPT